MSAGTASQQHAGARSNSSGTSAAGLQASQLLDARYDSVEALGQGTFGSVVQARHVQTGAAVAVKLLSRGPYLAATASNKPYILYVGREILHQASLSHPFVIQLFEVFLTPQHVAIVMEFADMGSLLAYQRAQPGRRLSEGTARWLFQQLVIGLDYAHQRGVSNRDLKLENLMLCRNSGPEAVSAERPLLKIGDFGYSKHDYNSSARTRCGTEVYMAPEVVTCNGKYDAKKADVWSCGVILYSMVAGCFPWTPGAKDCVQHIMQGKYSFPEGLQPSPGLRDLMSHILQPCPDQRWSTSQIMAHPWFLQSLPSGARHMNAFYMQHAPKVDNLAPQIGAILEAASRMGAPGEPHLSVQLRQPAPTVPPA